MWNEMPAPLPPVPSAGFNVIVQPNPASLILRHRQVRSKVNRWFPAKWAPGSVGEQRGGVPPPFGTALNKGQILDIGDSRVRANPEHFEFIGHDVTLEDIGRLTAEDQVKA
jgi:hypothetical protein